jgi:hypothetical protein
MKQYLGDGAYVDFDGYGLWLTAENGITATDRVYLEPEVWGRLVAYVDELKHKAPAAPPERRSDWIVELICCGHDAGIYRAATWDEADAFRESYCTGPGTEQPGGHVRAGIIREARDDE